MHNGTKWKQSERKNKQQVIEMNDRRNHESPYNKILNDMVCPKFDKLNLFHIDNININIDDIGCIITNINDEHDKCCPICLSNHEIPYIKLHKCKHVFHKACLESWISRFEFENKAKKNHSLCPTCRSSFTNIPIITSKKRQTLNNRRNHNNNNDFNKKYHDYYRKQNSVANRSVKVKSKDEIREKTNELLQYLKVNQKINELSSSERELKKLLSSSSSSNRRRKSATTTKKKGGWRRTPRRANSIHTKKMYL